MKASLMLLSALFLGATVAVAEEALVVNAGPTTSTIINSATLTVTNGTVSEGQLALFSSTTTFTIPSEDPDYATVMATAESNKLVIVPDAKGELLIADGARGDWVKTGVTIEENKPTTITAHIKVNGKTLVFDVFINGAETPISILAPSEGLTLNALSFEGEGSATGLSLALAPKNILPATGDDKLQDPALVNNYVAWVNEADKGGAIVNDASLSDADKSDAFAMNAGPKPTLMITMINIIDKTITVKGFYEKQTSAVPVDLSQINGTLYLTYASTLTGEVTVDAIDFTTQADGSAIIPMPEGAVFIKATVALTEPEATL